VGVEPTGDRIACHPPVLKTGTITGPHALPWYRDGIHYSITCPGALALGDERVATVQMLGISIWHPCAPYSRCRLEVHSNRWGSNDFTIEPDSKNKDIFWFEEAGKRRTKAGVDQRRIVTYIENKSTSDHLPLG
jgi:hypothetical protein